MLKSLIKSAIVGGIIVYVWGMISWIVLPWHITTINRFTNPDAVSQVIIDNTPKDGMYVLVNMPSSENDQQSTMSGPFMFASIQRAGMDMSSTKPFVISFIIQVVGAFFITWLYLQTKANRYWRGVFFITLIGFLVGILSLLTSWNWWGFSPGYVFVGIADLVISWFLGGLAIAKLARKT